MIYHVYYNTARNGYALDQPAERLTEPGACSPWNRWQGAVEVDVDVDVFQRCSKGCEELVGQWVEEETPD